MKAFAIATVSVILLSGGFLSSVDADDYTNPPTIEMTVGDLFEYEPMTNLSSVFSAVGTGILGDSDASEYAFLHFDGTTLWGEATHPGDYTADIVAVWTCPEDSSITQTTTQYIRFHVTDSESEEVNNVALSYGNGWTLKTTHTGVPKAIVSNNPTETAHAVSDDGSDSTTDPIAYERNIALAAIIVSVLCIGALAVRRGQ